MPENAAPVGPPAPESVAVDEQLVQTAKLAALGELVRGAAHEINNPLFGILGLVEFLLAEVEPGTKAHGRARLIQDSGLDIKAIVQALLGFARAQPGEVGVVPLQRTASAAVELLRRTRSTKTVELRESYAPEPVEVRCSAPRLTQLFLHLLLNAQQALGGGGTISIVVAREHEWALASVTDTGSGFQPEVLAKAFDPFFTTRREPVGAGLGLSASRQIAREHGGDLLVPPSDGRGTSVVLRLPAAEGEA